MNLESLESEVLEELHPPSIVRSGLASSNCLKAVAWLLLLNKHDIGTSRSLFSSLRETCLLS